MPTFARIVSFESRRGRFDDKGDSASLNEVLTALQARGASVKKVTPRIIYAEDNKLTIAIFLILYESDAYINV